MKKVIKSVITVMMISILAISFCIPSSAATLNKTTNGKYTTESVSFTAAMKRGGYVQIYNGTNHTMKLVVGKNALVCLSPGSYSAKYKRSLIGSAYINYSVKIAFSGGSSSCKGSFKIITGGADVKIKNYKY